MALHRPYIRGDVRAEVESRALRNEEGQFLDANTGLPIEGNYDLGHKAGHEFRTEQAKAEKEGLTQEQFNDRMNNPDLYQIESPSSNRSHKFEAKNNSFELESSGLSGVEASGRSRAEEAYGWQGVKQDEFGNIVDDSFPGHDNYQNGVLEHGSDTTIYCTNWTEGQPGSGYFTDQATVDSCTHDGVLNSNELGEALQTAPSNMGTNGGDYQHKPNCTAYDIDWNRLDELKNSDEKFSYGKDDSGNSREISGSELYEKLTNSDGKSPDQNDIKCAYGTAEANSQYGQGGGNQYYIDKDSFNAAREAGVFKENQEKSFSESKGNLSRTDIANDEAYANGTAAEKNKVMKREDEKQQPTPEQINQYQAKENPEKPFIAKPDDSYGYQKQNEEGKMPTTAANTDSGKEKDTAGGMPSSNVNKNQAEDGKNAAGGMPTNAAGQSGSAPNHSSENSKDMGQGMQG